MKYALTQEQVELIREGMRAAMGGVLGLPLDELVKMRDSIRDSIAFAQATGKPIPEAYKEEQ